MAYLVRVLVRPSVNAVVRDVQSSLGEPLNVPMLERPGHDGRVRTMPVKVLLGHLLKEPNSDQIEERRREKEEMFFLPCPRTGWVW